MSTTPKRTINDLTLEIRERVLDQQSIAEMLREVFLAAGEPESHLHCAGETVWEGLAAIQRANARECNAISELTEQIERQMGRETAH